MKRIILFFLFMLAFAGGALAQRNVVTGKAINAKDNKPVEFASVALLSADSTVVAGASTDETGAFKVRAKQAGRYILKISYVGYQPATKAVELSAKADSVNLGDVQVTPIDQVLGTATVTATAARVEQKDDTTMFNASAYRVPEGSTLEALVKQLPGVEVGDDGTIKWNGKTVTEFLVNGKDFFKGQTDVAMKNLPTELVSKIKAYDKKSDYTEQTGIDDGEETTVLDISTKRALNESWVSNLDVAYGNKDRYSARFFGTRFTDRTRITAYGSANNTNDQGFGGPRGFGGSSGLTATKDAGLDFSWENGKQKREAGRLELGGSVRYNHRSSDNLSISNSETFLTSGASSSFSNSWSRNLNSSTSVNANFRLQWSPDTLTTITFRPSFTHSDSHGSGSSQTATFNDDPYAVEGVDDPLADIFSDTPTSQLEAIAVNRNLRSSLSDSKSNGVSGSLNLVRRLNSKGRNISLRANAGYTKSESNSFSVSDIYYYNGAGTSANGANKHSFLNQYSTTPAKNYNYSARVGYVEPIVGNWLGEVRYEYSHRYQESDRRRYNLDSLAYEPYLSNFGLGQFGNPDDYPVIGTLPTVDEALNAVRDLRNSQYAKYKYYDHTVNAGIRYNSEKIRFNVGVDFNPQTTKMTYNRPGQNIDTLITRDVFKVAPSLRFRYKFSKTNQLNVNYRGRSSQPSMTDLLAVVDDSNPLSVSMGNPGLKPSWTNSLRVFYQGYNPDKQQGIAGGMFMEQQSNAVSNRLVYDEATGVRYTRPENINGNWNARGHFMFNTGIGEAKNLTVSTFTALGYDNSVGYVSRLESTSGKAALLPSAFAVGSSFVSRAATGETVAADRNYDYYSKIFNSAVSQKNTTKTFSVDENLNASYRIDWFDVGLLGRLNYQHARASVQDNANMDTWNFSYGANANFNFNFGLSISTDIRMSSRRGYSSASMNTNELLWNAQISQSFLKNRAATVSVQFYDILHQQSNVSRSLSATMRSDSWTNAINSYFMVHFIYKLNIFGGSSKKDSDSDRPRRPGPGGGPMPPMRMHSIGGGGHF